MGINYTKDDFQIAAADTHQTADSSWPVYRGKGGIVDARPRHGRPALSEPRTPYTKLKHDVLRGAYDPLTV